MTSRAATWWGWLRCKVGGHSGHYSVWEIDQRDSGLRIERLLRRECLNCGRVEYLP